MQRPHDERAKLIAEQTLDALGEVRREVEVPASDAQRIDLWFRRLFSPGPVPEHLRLLAAIFVLDCLIEVFCQAVSLEDFWESERKQLGWRHFLQGQAAAAEPGGTAPLVRRPWLWLLSAGHPEALFEAHDIARRPGLPPGIYDLGRGYNIGLVVISELPTGRETLLLRLMGSPAVRKAALAELAQMPDGAPEVQTLRRIVASLRHTMKNATSINQEEREEFMTTAWAEFERYEEQIRQEGRKEARQQTLRENIVSLCKVLRIELTTARREVVEHMDVPTLESLRGYLEEHHVWPASAMVP